MKYLLLSMIGLVISANAAHAELTQVCTPLGVCTTVYNPTPPVATTVLRAPDGHIIYVIYSDGSVQGGY